MFRLMRNLHLGLGLIFVLMALIFAVSSLVFMYRPLFRITTRESEMSIQLSPEAAATPRAAARELMTRHGFKGDLREIREQSVVRFRIVRAGEHAEVQYTPAIGEAKIKVRKHGAFDTMVQLHINHGLSHEYAPMNFWSAISLFTSVGLLLLGATGIYLWLAHHNERLIGGILLGFGLVYGVVTLVLTRMEG
jgi:hypothetical protein